LLRYARYGGALFNGLTAGRVLRRIFSVGDKVFSRTKQHILTVCFNDVQLNKSNYGD
jgi:hypothetical protein